MEINEASHRVESLSDTGWDYLAIHIHGVQVLISMCVAVDLFPFFIDGAIGKTKQQTRWTRGHGGNGITRRLHS